jgi:very-short-patch-repair endonuclease
MDGASPPPVRRLRLVAVEFDGAQHLADSVAYRRDRRKDQVLQENGRLVPRFLAEGVGRELDVVLDAILRALSHRQLTHHQWLRSVSYDEVGRDGDGPAWGA